MQPSQCIYEKNNACNDIVEPNHTSIEIYYELWLTRSEYLGIPFCIVRGKKVAAERLLKNVEEC